MTPRPRLGVQMFVGLCVYMLTCSCVYMFVCLCQSLKRVQKKKEQLDIRHFLLTRMCDSIGGWGYCCGRGLQLSVCSGELNTRTHTLLLLSAGFTYTGECVTVCV